MIEARTMHGLAKIDFVDCITGNYEPSYDNRPQKALQLNIKLTHTYMIKKQTPALLENPQNSVIDKTTNT